MNETIQTMLSRKSVKKYKPDAVPQEYIEAIVRAGMQAPTGLNKQSPIILAITDRQVRDQLSKINAGNDPFFRSDPFYGAPCVLVVLAKKDVPTHVYDGSLVMGNLLLAAHSLGLGACWIHRAKETFETEEGKALLKSLGIEEEYEGIGNCIVGYPDMQPAEMPRKENWVYYIK